MMRKSATTERKKAIEAVVSLIPACLRGEKQSREMLARWCLPKVRRTVMLTYGTGADADDLVQTVVVKILSRLESYRGDAGFYTWVDRITVNVIKDHFRSRRFKSRWELTDDLDTERAAASQQPDAALERYRLMKCLAKHLESIKIDKRLPVVLALSHGYTAPEIANILDIRVETAKKRLQRGRKELLALLNTDPRFAEVRNGWQL